MKTAHIQITEHKTNDPSKYANNMVRIFVNHDWRYGYFVDEKEVFASLNEDDQNDYANKTEFDIPLEKAQHLIDIGYTYPYFE